MRLEDMREQFPKMPESMKRMIEQEVTVQIGQEKENDNPKVVTYKKRKKKPNEAKKKKNKKMQELHDSIKVGDEILTMGGIIATVKERDGEILTVEIDPEKEICMKILVYSVSTIRK